MSKHIWLGIIFFAVVAGVCGFLTRVAPRWNESHQGDLAWLKNNFALSTEQLQQIETLHNEYAPRCREMCERLRIAKEKIRTLMLAGPGNQPALDEAIREAARMEGECRVAVIAHVAEVARAMPPNEGNRYLAEMAPYLTQMPNAASYSMAHSHEKP